MANEPVVVGAVLGGLALLLIAGKTHAAGKFTCMYGDGLTFDTIEQLQEHVRVAHPGERIPIDIQWQ